MSDTPRTDAEIVWWEHGDCAPEPVVPAHFAQQLERELNQARTPKVSLQAVMEADDDRFIEILKELNAAPQVSTLRDANRTPGRSEPAVAAPGHGMFGPGRWEL